LENFRQIFLVTKKVFLNHAAHSLLPKPVRDAMWEYDDEFSEYGDTMDLDGGKPSLARLVNGFTTPL
jgi:hypothetical protein